MALAERRAWWQLGRREVRSSAAGRIPPGEQSILDAIGQATGKVDIRRTAAYQAGVVLIEGAFGALRVEGAGPYAAALDRQVLRCIGRELAECGESLHVLELSEAGLSLLPAGSWDVIGRDPNPKRWAYRADLYAPDANFTRTYLPGAVIHCRINARAAAPWKGRAAWELAADSVTTQRLIEDGIRGEAAFAPARIVPQLSGPGGQTGFTGKALAAGGVHVAQTGAQNAAWGNDKPGRVDPTKIQPDPAERILRARTAITGEIWASMGIPPELLAGGVEGAAAREAYRRWTFTSVQPMADAVAEELSTKLEIDVHLDTGGLAAADMAGRARALGILAKAGMPLESARQVVGL